MAREYFLTYHDNLSALKLLSDSERGRLYLALLEYSAKDENPKYENPVLNGNEKFLFEIIKTQIDREKDKYKKQCEANKENGKFGVLGGRPRKNTEGKPKRVLKTPKEDKEKEEYKDKNEEEEKYKDKYEKKEKVEKEKHGEFKNVLLTFDEVEKLRMRLGNNFESLLEEMSSGIAAKGYKYKDHYAALLNWSKRKNPNEGVAKNGTGNSANTDFEGKPKINKYPNGTDVDWSIFDGCET